MTPSLRSAVLLVASSLILGGCSSDGGGDSGPQATVIGSIEGDFGVCTDTIGVTMVLNGQATGPVGDDERNDESFLAGECRAIILFDSKDVAAEIPSGTIIDSLQLFVHITSTTGAPQGSNAVIESIEWNGFEPDAYSALDESIAPVIFSASNGGYIFNAGEILPVGGTGGLMAYRIRALEPDPLDGNADSWNVAMFEAGSPTRATLTYFWTR